jgi:very-short-patch-repair endonuclease
MPVRNIVIGQTVDAAKVQRAKELRRRMTAEERRLWEHLRTNRLDGFHFRRQQVIDGFIVDFYCHAAGLMVELDGAIHQQQEEYDAERDRRLSAHGLRVLRIRNQDVWNDLDDVLACIAVACRGET